MTTETEAGPPRSEPWPPQVIEKLQQRMAASPAALPRRVRIRQGLYWRMRTHLETHAFHRDVGVVVTGQQRAPKMAGLYTIVSFERCGHTHRLLEGELEDA